MPFIVLQKIQNAQRPGPKMFRPLSKPLKFIRKQGSVSSR